MGVRQFIFLSADASSLGIYIDKDFFVKEELLRIELHDPSRLRSILELEAVEFSSVRGL